MKVIYKQMLEFDDIDDDYDFSSSVEEELEILDEAYRNAFAVATGKMSVSELLDRSPDMIFLPFDPSDPSTFKLVVEDMIKYFEESEEYEKCAELISAKDKLDDFR